MFSPLFTDSLGNVFNGDVQWLLGYAENTVLFIFLSTAMFVVVSTPLFLLYQSIDNYYRAQKSKLELEHNTDSDTLKVHPKYKQTLYSLYAKTYRSFLSNSMGLLAWFLSTLGYVIIAYGSIQEGIQDYFRFPFAVFETYHFDEAMLSITSHDGQWIIMLGIFILTVIGFRLGKSLANQILKKNLPANWENVSFA